MNRILSCAFLLLAMEAPAFASVVPFLSGDVPWLVAHSQAIVTLSSAAPVFHSEVLSCSTVEVTVEHVLRNATTTDALAPGKRLTALDRDEVIQRLCGDGQCNFDRMVFYLAPQNSSTCGVFEFAVIGMSPPQSNGHPAKDIVADYLAAGDKVAWALQALNSRPGDETVSRIAVATALEGKSEDANVRSLLRQVALSDQVTPDVREDALKVLDTTGSPEKNFVIEHLPETTAPLELKQQSLRMLDQSDASKQILIRIGEKYPAMAGSTAGVLNDRFGKDTLKKLGINTLPVADPKATAVAAINSILSSNQAQSTQKEGVVTMIKRVPVQSRKGVFDAIEKKKLTDLQKAMLATVAMEMKP